MKYFRFYLPFLFLVACQSGSQLTQKSSTSTPPADRGPVLFTLDSLPVYAEEFRYLYEKNYSRDSSLYSEASLQEYLDLFVKFKLKVHEAFERQMDQAPAFKQEFASYQKQLAGPYLTDRQYSEKMVQEAYNRVKQEVSASHILIQASLAAHPSDTLKAYKKALDLKKKLDAGADFAATAKEFSEDPSAQQNGGYLGYFTGMQMVYAFESAAYEAPIGSIYGPVRTSFGYHLIKVHARRPTNGSVKVAHLLIRASEDASEEVITEAEKRMAEIYQRMQKGEDFAKLVRQFSEDQQTRYSGGELPPFSVGRYPEPFAEAAFSLQPGQLSEPVRTAYGFHLIKMIERMPIASFEEMKPALEQKIAKDSRSEVSRQRFVEKLKLKNDFREKLKFNEKIFQQMDTSLLSGNFTLPTADGNLLKPMFTIGNDSYLVKDYYAFVRGRQQPRQNITAPVYARELYQQFVSKANLDYEEQHLEASNLDYRRLLNEYREGILLFSIMEEEVWNKAVQDDQGQKAFFEENIARYQWGQRVKARIVSFASDSLRMAFSKGYQTGSFQVVPNKAIDQVAFGLKSSAFTPELEKDVAKAMAILLKDTTLTLSISADYVAGEGKTLAQKRLTKVKEYLSRSGIAVSRILVGAIEKATARAKTDKSGGKVYFAYYTTQYQNWKDLANQANPLAVQVQEGTFEKGSNPQVDQVTWQEGSYTIDQEDRFGLVQVLEVVPPQAKQLTEIRGQVISDYQEQLEKEWIELLRKKYEVKLNQDVFNNLIKK